MGQPQCLVARQAAVGFLQAIGHGFHAVIRRQCHATRALIAQLVHPLCQALRGFAGRHIGHAKAFQVDKAANALGSGTRIPAGDIAAHAVAHQINGLIGRELIEQHVQVGQIVGEVIAVARRGSAAQAKTAPVGGDNAAALHKGVAESIDHKLVGRSHIHPAVGQHQHGQIGVDLLGLPAAQVVVHIAHRQHLGLPDSSGLVGLGVCIHRVSVDIHYCGCQSVSRRSRDRAKHAVSKKHRVLVVVLGWQDINLGS